LPHLHSVHFTFAPIRIWQLARIFEAFDRSRPLHSATQARPPAAASAVLRPGGPAGHGVFVTPNGGSWGGRRGR